MEFIRDDGRVYNPKHRDTIKRLVESDRFRKMEDCTVEVLKAYARARDITGHSSMTRAELIEALKEGD